MSTVATDHFIQPPTDVPATARRRTDLRRGETDRVESVRGEAVRPLPPVPARHPPNPLAGLGVAFAEQAATLDRSGDFPFGNFRVLHERGLIADIVPIDAGGGGATLARARRVIAATAYGEPSTALVLAMTFLLHRTIGATGSRWPQSLRDLVWQSAVDDGALANHLRVEPALGSPARGGLPDTIARRSGTGWRLSGHKIYATGIRALTWLAVWARTDEAVPRVGLFLVRRDPARDEPALRIIETWDHLGLRASGSHDVIFDDLQVPFDQAADLRLPEEWAGGPEPDQSAWQIVLLGALYDAVARAARDWLLDFLRERAPANLGAALATVPRIQQVVGEIEALLWSNDALLGDLAARVDTGDTPPTSASGLAKFTVTANAVRVVELAMQLSGNHGLSRHHPLERHWRNVQCSRIHTPQDDSILVAAGRAALLG